jgi:hypothetical protein
MEWIKLKNELPPPDTCVWVKRKFSYPNGNITYLYYLGIKTIQKSFAEKPYSQWNCIIMHPNILTIMNQELQYEFGYRESFSDLTIDSWSLTHIKNDTDLNIRTVLCEKHTSKNNVYKSNLFQSLLSNYSISGNQNGVTLTKYQK